MMASKVSRLIPARFLALMSHLVIAILLMWDVNVAAETCSGLSVTTGAGSVTRERLIVGIAITFFFLACELGGFLTGVTMFMNAQSLLSIGSHLGAAVGLLFFSFEEWPCSHFWWIFGFCSVFPFVTETVSIVAFFKEWNL